MPIYEYRRPDGTTFEIQQSFSEDTLVVDPDSGEPVARVFHPPAVHFKGKGFYNTDYGTRNRQRETAAAAADSSSSSNGSSAEGSSAKDSSAKDSSAKDSSAKDSSANGSSARSDSQSSASDPNAKSDKGSKDSSKRKRRRPVPATS